MKIIYKNIDYLVMGICYFNDNKKTYYLIEEENKVKWISEVFIEVKKSKIPFNWSISLENNLKYNFLCGYYELCNSLEHFEGIISENKKDLEIFKKRKKELEIWLEKLDYYNKEITFNDILSKIRF
ncbi:hypothetical protein [Leptotrichia buccalis]|jgi:hypothetical protein|uniref:Uncharacterized protein n=1 Tax=Leptotrichia buccalis (strain ATCC 14201 / DSM 1135 / JCM 12969 / NCTC 10249 / C-1013-b) TaxID=523794 RepID=C7NA63_LEPBD|nr:hypothetical protein [Leptotrichia buccalis]ACV39044.1 hypothetical protein Lebu_1148 [Leptotrichia buccalis C-1013-b]